MQLSRSTRSLLSRRVYTPNTRSAPADNTTRLAQQADSSACSAVPTPTALQQQQHQQQHRIASSGHSPKMLRRLTAGLPACPAHLLHPGTARATQCRRQQCLPCCSCCCLGPRPYCCCCWMPHTAAARRLRLRLRPACSAAARSSAAASATAASPHGLWVWRRHRQQGTRRLLQISWHNNLQVLELLCMNGPAWAHNTSSSAPKAQRPRQ